MTPDIFADAVRRARKAKRATTQPQSKPKKRKVTAQPVAPLEKAEQAALFRWASYAVITHPELHELYAIPNAGGYVGGYQNNMQRVMAMKREGVRAGVPDLCLPYARGEYYALYIELKRIGAAASAVSDRQRDWHERLKSAGNAVEVCMGWQAARDVLLSYLALPPGTSLIGRHRESDPCRL